VSKHTLTPPTHFHGVRTPNPRIDAPESNLHIQMATGHTIWTLASIAVSRLCHIFFQTITKFSTDVLRAFCTVSDHGY